MPSFSVPKTSTTLLRDVSDSTQARWAVFYARYEPMMRAYLCERFPTLDADDIVQETFVALVKILPNYQYDPDTKGTFHNFLTGVLRNKALCAIDKRNRQKTVEERMRENEPVKGLSQHEQTYADWRKSVFEVALKQVLADDSIQDRTKQAFVSTAIKGESIEAVATRLGVSRHAVECMRARVTERLQNLVEQMKTIC